MGLFPLSWRKTMKLSGSYCTNQIFVSHRIEATRYVLSRQAGQPTLRTFVLRKAQANNYHFQRAALHHLLANELSRGRHARHALSVANMRSQKTPPKLAHAHRHSRRQAVPKDTRCCQHYKVKTQGYLTTYQSLGIVHENALLDH